MSFYVISILVSCGLIGIVSGAIGTYAVLQKKSLLADSISHSLLPGIMLGFLITKEKDPVLISLGATISGLISAYLTDWLVAKTKLNQDAAIGINLSLFFGLGVVLLTYIQSGNYGGQSGLTQLLLGNAASMQQSDIFFFSALGLFLALSLLFLGKELNLICFNKDFAKSIGLPVARLEFLLRLLLVLTIVAGIQAVGVVLMASCLIAPVIAAKYWSISLRRIQIISTIIGCLSGVLGALFSYYFNHVPTGPLIVLILTFVAFFSMFFGIEKGLLRRFFKERSNRFKIQADHILKELFYLNEQGNETGTYHIRELKVFSESGKSRSNRILKRLARKGFLITSGTDITITEKGKSEANKIVRLHRLWELYLLKRLEIPADHVHDNAEQIEHILSPELEAALLKELDYPVRDPHNSPIPNE
ncbi:metal ABC transporter permease [Luteibaculum oceani]|uniref:Iron chelate uptake ABC transporter family permease subunit n=1 Tax=Luteibaculum oceani TaxID=1294296 RepID=A0A5C6VEC6_9FLAO|nr:iron chelate uptake ABC transporter family permease subunit [Luteibaculum oceani]TXC82165.1 iron chelate uptake ABC transporter family permease subunit [Luteibaculum oceani]